MSPKIVEEEGDGELTGHSCPLLWWQDAALEGRWRNVCGLVVGAVRGRTVTTGPVLNNNANIISVSPCTRTSAQLTCGTPVSFLVCP